MTDGEIVAFLRPRDADDTESSGAGRDAELPIVGRKHESRFGRSCRQGARKVQGVECPDGSRERVCRAFEHGAVDGDQIERAEVIEDRPPTICHLLVG